MPPPAGAARGAQARILRIIGGRWRGRRLRFPAVDEIRPTPDRVRETLFNWLGSRVPGLRCLDLFAGSGALGLEALSRGAAHVTFVERDSIAVRELRSRLSEWGGTDATVVAADALAYLQGTVTPFDLAFLDPPFAAGLLADSAQQLERRGWLRRNALIYVETDRHAALPALPSNWQPDRAKRAGTVGYHLLTRVDGQQHEGVSAA